MFKPSIYILSLVCGCLCDNYPRNVTKVLTVDNGGYWGQWHPWSFCAEGYFASGYMMKIEGNQHGHDDTALNSVHLRCLNGNHFGGHISSGEGEYGIWTGWTDCKVGDHITEFALQVEPDQGSGDDTAANFIKFKCRNIKTGSMEYELANAPGHGLFGRYGSWSERCPHLSAVCGMQTRVEGPQGGGNHGDDTSLNNVKLFCCAK